MPTAKSFLTNFESPSPTPMMQPFIYKMENNPTEIKRNEK